MFEERVQNMYNIWMDMKGVGWKSFYWTQLVHNIVQGLTVLKDHVLLRSIKAGRFLDQCSVSSSKEKLCLRGFNLLMFVKTSFQRTIVCIINVFEACTMCVIVQRRLSCFRSQRSAFCLPCHHRHV